MATNQALLSGGQEVGIDIPDAAPEQPLTIDELQHFSVRGAVRLRQPPQHAQNLRTPPQIAERELTQHERVPEHLAVAQQRREYRAGRPQVIDPDRRVDEDHAGFGRRRGILFRSGSLPPSRANRRAASRSTNALSASRMSADFSRIPV